MPQPHLVGLITDSHDNKPAIEKAMAQFTQRDVGLILHGGDYIAPFNAKWMAGIRVPFVGVFGNNDGEKFGLRAQFESLGPIHRPPYVHLWEGKRILMLHEPDEVAALANSGCYDIIFYGHTHKIDIQKGKTLVINPGEAGGWTTGRETVGILDLNAMEVEIVDL
ncbi:MAG: metallophosphoesterase [bacterium]|nr:metallophosphoesterase [bacterium]